MARVWIKFELKGPSATGKTDRWAVVALEGSSMLGTVQWFGRWRRYAFFPSPGCVFEQDCLRHIAEFCEKQTREHRAGRKVA